MMSSCLPKKEIEYINPEKERKIINLIIEDPSIIRLIKNKYLTEDMWKAAIDSEPSIFQYMKDPSEKMILYALSKDGANIQYLSKMNVIITDKMIYTAIDEYPEAIKLLPYKYQTAEIKEYASIKNPVLLRSLNLSKGFIDQQLKKDPTLIRYIDNPTEDQLCRALKANPNMISFIEFFTPKMISLIKELYPDIIPMIPNLSSRIRSQI